MKSGVVNALTWFADPFYSLVLLRHFRISLFSLYASRPFSFFPLLVVPNTIPSPSEFSSSPRYGFCARVLLSFFLFSFFRWETTQGCRRDQRLKWENRWDVKYTDSEVQRQRRRLWRAFPSISLCVGMQPNSYPPYSSCRLDPLCLSLLHPFPSILEATLTVLLV